MERTVSHVVVMGTDLIPWDVPDTGKSSGNSKMPKVDSICRILYCNLNRSVASHDAVGEIVKEWNVELCCYSEPNRNLVQCENTNFCTDPRIDVAMISRNGCISVGCDDGFTWMECKECVFVTCYISPNPNMDAFKSFLNKLGTCIMKWKKGVVVNGDFNAWSTVWGCRRTDGRGLVLMDWIAETGLILVNNGAVATCVRGLSESVIDLTLCNRLIGNRIHKWRVLAEQETLSDHLAIYMEIVLSNNPDTNKQRLWLKRYQPMHRLRLVDFFMDQLWEQQTAEELQNVTMMACSEVIGYRSTTRRRIPSNHWWNTDLTAMRRNCIRARRELSRARRSLGTDVTQLIATHKNASSRLRKAIKEAKERVLEQTLQDLDDNPWGQAGRQNMEAQNRDRSGFFFLEVIW